MGFVEAMAFFIVGAIAQNDLTYVAAGLLAAEGKVAYTPAVLGCVIGTVAGDLAWIAFGRFLGSRVLSSKFVERIASRSLLDRCVEWVKRHGAKALFISAFLPGMRTPVHLTVGMLRVDLWVGTLYLTVAATINVLVLVVGAAWLGRTAERYLNLGGVPRQVLLLGAIVAIWLIYKVFQRWYAHHEAAELEEDAPTPSPPP